MCSQTTLLESKTKIYSTHEQSQVGERSTYRNTFREFKRLRDKEIDILLKVTG